MDASVISCNCLSLAGNYCGNVVDFLQRCQKKVIYLYLIKGKVKPILVSDLLLMIKIIEVKRTLTIFCIAVPNT